MGAAVRASSCCDSTALLSQPLAMAHRITQSPNNERVDAPAAWLVDHVDLLPRGLPILDVAAGAGRHALYLASRGWTVHAIDRDAARLAGLDAAACAADLPITVEVQDLETGAPSLPPRAYGGVVVFNYLHRPLMPAIVDAVADGGVLIYETFTIGQAARGRPTNPAFLLHPGELPRLAAPLVVEHWREGDVDGRLVASIVAVRR